MENRLALPARASCGGGVCVMTWISLIGITLAVFALIATLAVRSGFRSLHNAGLSLQMGRIDQNPQFLCHARLVSANASSRFA